MKTPVSVAPMMDVTDRHCRYLMRILSPNIKLYTEMKVTGAIINGDRSRCLGFDPFEHPVALQLGGCVPEDLAYCADLAGQWGYDEVNLNVGCPSDRVKHARFGACLMNFPDLVSQCVEAMIEATKIPVTVKTRLGIDHSDSYEFLTGFIQKISSAGCRTFHLHARKAWLKGLSPKQNRTIPPLNYDRVYRLKQDFPDLEIILNGGVSSVSEIQTHLAHVDGVMIGREAYKNLWFLREIDEFFFASESGAQSCYGAQTRNDVSRAYMAYMMQQAEKGVPLKMMTRHLTGLYHGQAGARSWRRNLTCHEPRTVSGECPDELENTLRIVAEPPPAAMEMAGPWNFQRVQYP